MLENKLIVLILCIIFFGCLILWYTIKIIECIFIMCYKLHKEEDLEVCFI